MKNKNLVLLTFSFPYGRGEAFLETELKYLSEKFDKIFILNFSQPDELLRTIDSNVYPIRMFKKKHNFWSRIYLFKQLFGTRFYKELFFIKNVLKQNISIHKIKTILFSISNAKHVSLEVLKTVSSNQLNLKETVFYSYWMDESAIALSLLAENNKEYKCINRTHRWDLYFDVNHENYLPLRPFITMNCQCYSISSNGVDYLNTLLDIKNIKLAKLGINSLKKNENNSKEFVIVSCSYLVPVKRVSLIIKSLSLIPDYKVKWIHFGDGPLKNECIALAIKNNLLFDFKGSVSNQTVLEFLQNKNVDLFINLSESEGIPVSIMEAMACGIPVIATDVGGTSEIVTNNNGFLLDSNPKKEDVALAITNYFNLSLEEKDLKKNRAYETWKTSFNSKINYTHFTNELLDL